MKIDIQIIPAFLSFVFALLGLFNYLLADEPWMILWIISFICLLATNLIDIVERIDFEIEQD